MHHSVKAKLLDIKVLSKKGKYNFCMPVYIIKSWIKIAAGEEHKNIVDLWSCPTVSKIQLRNWKLMIMNAVLLQGENAVQVHAVIIENANLLRKSL
jgi:hypothetical protein